MNEILSKRVKNILSQNKNIKSENLHEVIKSDIAEILNNYFVFDEQSVEIEITPQGTNIMFSCKAMCEKIKTLKIIC